MEEKNKIIIGEDEFRVVMAMAINETTKIIYGAENKSVFISLAALVGEKAWDMLIGFKSKNKD